jgi:hypothetical protein
VASRLWCRGALFAVGIACSGCWAAEQFSKLQPSCEEEAEEAYDEGYGAALACVREYGEDGC